MDVLNAIVSSAKQVRDWAENKLNSKVDKVTNKGLSTNDYTTEDKNKVDNIANELKYIDGKIYLAKDGVEILSSGTTIPSGGSSNDGVGIQSVEQTTTSTSDGGTNVITITLTDGRTSTFNVKNGSAGKTPVRGTDYWTDTDKAEIKAYVDDAILEGVW